MRVVSAPCWNAFEREDAAYRDAVLPPGVRRAAIEIGVTEPWRGVVGPDGLVIGWDTFGNSYNCSGANPITGICGNPFNSYIPPPPSGTTFTSHGMTFPQAHPRLWFTPARLTQAKSWLAANS